MSKASIYLSQDEKETILKGFPNIKLSYENVIYKKVYNADSYVAIPYGIKCFAWFTIYRDRNVCFIMELTENKQIADIKVTNVCFSSSLSYGTILYGTKLNHLTNDFFSVEDVFQYNGNLIERENWGNKYILMKNLFKKDIKQAAYNASFIVFGLPLITNSIDNLMKKMETITYKIDSIQFRSFHRSNNYLFITYKNFIQQREGKPLFEKPKDILKETPKETAIEKPKDILKEKPRQDQRKKEAVFLVKPDIQNDIYHLYYVDDGVLVFHSIACIPDYNCSVMMNRLFRNIKENQNLDALEESDDEEEFQDEREDRFVHLERSYNMLCQFHYKFKKWFPVKVADQKTNVSDKREISFINYK
jgi:hypothetical protein